MSRQAAPSSRRSPFGSLTVLTFAVMLVLGMGHLAAPSAAAHAALRTSNPTDGAVVVNLPPRYELVFNESIDPNFAQIVIADSAGGTHAQSEVEVRGPSVSGPFPRDLPAGTTAIRFRVVSADGHPVAGEISFELRTAGAEPSAGTTSEPAGTQGATNPPAAAQAPAAERGEGIGNVTMLALGGIGALIFLAVAGLLIRADRRRH